MTPAFRSHNSETSNNRAVRKGNDPRCITGYHQLWHGYALQGDKAEHDTDIAAAPLDAPHSMPAGCCQGGNLENGKRTACQSITWRE